MIANRGLFFSFLQFGSRGLSKGKPAIPLELVGIHDNRIHPGFRRNVRVTPNGVMARGKKTAHVIDDMSDQLQFMERHLERSGFSVELHSEFDALKYAMSRRDANAVFVDVRPGPVDAIDVLRFLADRQSRASIFLMSGDLVALDVNRRYVEEVGIVIADCLVTPSALADQHQCRPGQHHHTA